MDAEGDLEAEADVGVVQVQAGDLADPVEAVEDGVAVDGQDGGRLLGGAVGLEERLQGPDQVGAMLLVVGEQRGERLVVELADLRQALGGEDDPVDAEVPEGRRVARTGGLAGPGPTSWACMARPGTTALDGSLL